MTTAPPSRTTPPVDAIGKYRLLTQLGSGGMADVYLALARGPAGFNKLSVVKRLKQSLADEPDSLAMFLSEAQLAARLNHPNVVQTFEVGGDQGENYLVMEYLDGQSLDRLLRRAPAGARTLPCLLRAACDALGGLHYAHELCDYDGTPLNVVHRDVSPRNVFVTYEGQTKVLDFGIAKALRASHVSRAGTLKGTVRYMAPEQVFGLDVDRRTDVFAVGVILWELLAGRRMWPGLDDVVILQRLMQGQIPSLEEVKPDAPPELARVCGRALAVEAARRYPSALHMRAELEAAIAARGLEATTAEVSALVVETFRDEREALRRLIEQQFARAGECGPPSASGALGAESARFDGVAPSGRGGSSWPPGREGASSPSGLGGASWPPGQGGASPPSGQGGASWPPGQGGASPPPSQGGASWPPGQGGASWPPGPGVASTRASGPTTSTPPGQPASVPPVGAFGGAPFPPPPPVPASSLHVGAAYSAPPPGSYTTPGVTALPVAAGRRRLAWLLVGLAGAAALGLVALKTGRFGSPPTTPPDALEASASLAESTTAPAPSAPPTAPATVELRVFSRPSRAQVFLDANPLGETPLKVTLPRGGEHALRLEAPGRQTLSQQVSLEHDVTIELLLARAAPVGHAALHPSSTAGPKAEHPDPIGTRLLEAAPPARRTPPPLDTSSPY